MVVVRPWKLPAATMILAWSGRDALDLVAPLAGDLDRGLDGLGAGVHRQHHLLAAQVAERGGRTAEPVVLERPAGEGQPVELGVRGREQARVAVAEVQRGVAGEQVQVAVPSTSVTQAPSAVRDHHRQRVVVVRAVRRSPRAELGLRLRRHRYQRLATGNGVGVLKTRSVLMLHSPLFEVAREPRLRAPPRRLWSSVLPRTTAAGPATAGPGPAAGTRCRAVPAGVHHTGRHEPRERPPTTTHPPNRPPTTPRKREMPRTTTPRKGS